MSNLHISKFTLQPLPCIWKVSKYFLPIQAPVVGNANEYILAMSANKIHAKYLIMIFMGKCVHEHIYSFYASIKCI